MTSVLKNIYTDKLDDIADKYNNVDHKTIKMKTIDIKTSTCIDFDIENNDKDPKIKAGDHVRIPKYINVFTKGYTKRSFLVKSSFCD